VKPGSWLKSRYDKLAALTMLIVLVASLVVLAVKSRQRPEPLPPAPASPHAAQPIDEAVYEETLERLKAPRPAPPRRAGLFSPEPRVECPDCYRPIPIETFRNRQPCPFCKHVPPAPPEDYDGDGDGMWDAWERKYGLDPTDPSDAGLDSDDDGYTNVEEFRFGTSPTDADKSPVGKTLHVAEVVSRLFPLEFTSVTTLSTGSQRFGVNADGQTHFGGVGDEIMGYTIVKYRPGAQAVAGQSRASSSAVPSLMLEKEGKTVSIEKGRSHSEHTAVLVSEIDSEEYEAVPGSTLQIRGMRYEVEAVDSDSRRVHLLSPQGRPIEIPPSPSD